MCYRCDICDVVVPKGTPKQVHLTYKLVEGLKQIAREIPICGRCKGLLDIGTPLAMMRKQLGKPIPTFKAPPKPLPVIKGSWSGGNQNVKKSTVSPQQVVKILNNVRIKQGPI